MFFMMAAEKFHEKTKARKIAKAQRDAVVNADELSLELIRYFPLQDFRGAVFSGFWPIGSEIDLRPLMSALCEQGERVCLPVTGPKGTALSFRRWTPQSPIRKGRFETMEPDRMQDQIIPDFLFVPLLAFDMQGGRLGYGGGYYDRTLASLSKRSAIITCGVGFDAQERRNVPMSGHDVRLDCMLTPSGFKRLK